MNISDDLYDRLESELRTAADHIEGHGAYLECAQTLRALAFELHRINDPHCTCNDCIEAFAAEAVASPECPRCGRLASLDPALTFADGRQQAACACGCVFETFAAGDAVTTSGYPGVIVRQYSAGMFEVRLASGLVCVPAGDIVRRGE